MPVRIPVVAVVLVLGLTCGVVALGALPDTHSSPSAPGERAQDREAPAGEAFAVGVLHGWDDRRADAWGRGDATALSRIYTAGSAAGAADVRLLRRYAARGLVVRDLRMQLLRARVLVVRPGRIELEVVDRLAGATAVGAGGGTLARRLPADRPTTRRLVLRREHGQWLMASVSRAKLRPSLTR
jgi:hypothetical protein